MNDICIARLALDQMVPVGRISQDGSRFTYDSAYLAREDAIPLSLSIPLRDEAFDAPLFRPYFEGLLAEGMARQELAAELQISEDDYLGILVSCGRECIGDVVAYHVDDAPNTRYSEYDPIPYEELCSMFRSRSELAAENAASRLSLAGTQNKIGLALPPQGDWAHGWLRPRGFAATTHILKTSYLRDLPEIEYLCMQAARACGITVPDCQLLDLAQPVLAVSRFDRLAEVRDGSLRVVRLHQEDLAQALGCTPGSKYAELPGGTVRSIVRLIRRRSTRPAHDIRQFAATILYSYVIGNCDAHLKNYSIRLSPARPGRLASFMLMPAYDLVSTTYFPRFSRDMAMEVGGVRDIDRVTPEAFATLADDLGISSAALKRLAKAIVENAAVTIRDAGDGAFGATLASTPYIAADLIEDIEPRLEVLAAFCGDAR